MSTTATIHRYSTPFLKKRIYAISRIVLGHYKGKFTVILKQNYTIDKVQQHVNDNYRTLSQKHHPRVWKRLQAKVDSILAEEELH